MDDIDVGQEEQPMETDAGSKIAPIFPLSRVKKIMKTDKDVHMCTAEAVALTAMAAENFLEFFSDALCKQAIEDRKRTVSYKEAVSTVKSDPRLEFLAPLIPPTIPINKALELKKVHVISAGNLQSDDEASVEAV